MDKLKAIRILASLFLSLCFSLPSVNAEANMELLPGCDKKTSESAVNNLISAVRSGKVSRIERLAKSGIDLNCDPSGPLEAPKPFLVEAVLSLRPDVVEVLMKEGATADFSYPPADSMSYLTSPLLTAAGLNRYDIVYIMIDNGASIDAKDSVDHGIGYYLRASRILKRSSGYKWYLEVKKIHENNELKSGRNPG